MSATAADFLADTFSTTFLFRFTGILVVALVIEMYKWQSFERGYFCLQLILVWFHSMYMLLPVYANVNNFKILQTLSNLFIKLFKYCPVKTSLIFCHSSNSIKCRIKAKCFSIYSKWITYNDPCIRIHWNVRKLRHSHAQKRPVVL